MPKVTGTATNPTMESAPCWSILGPTQIEVPALHRANMENSEAMKVVFHPLLTASGA